MPHEALEQIDRSLVALSQGTAALRLGVGEALVELSCHGGPLELGFASLEAYAKERCEQSGRWARDSRALAKRLRERPAIRAALVSGELSWSMAELLARHGQPADEAQLLDEARGKTVRKMREHFRQQAEEESREAKSSADHVVDEPEPLVTLTVTMTAEEAWAFECTKMLVQALGAARDSDVIDSMLAEGMTTLLNAVPDGADELEQSLECAPFADADQAKRHREWQQQLASWRDEAEERCEARIPARVAAPAELAELVTAPEDLPADAVALDGIIVGLSQRLLRRDLELGDELRRLCDGNGWRRLGYASLGQYARERLGLSLSSAKARMTLSRRAGDLDPLREAIERAAVGFEAAMLVGRVATKRTVKAWLERAQERTIKHLGEEVATAEVLGRTSGKGAPPPPDAETQAAMMALESHVLSGAIFRGERARREGQISVTPEREGAVADSMEGQNSVTASSDGTEAAPGRGRIPHEEDCREPRPRLGAGKVTLRWRVTADVARAWHALAKLHRRSHLSGTLVELLCAATWEVWKHALGSEVAYADLYARERYRCSSPVCFSRNQTPHHVVFRSQGGDDDPENLTAPCACCHLEGIHGGTIQARGPASELRWKLGSEPIVEVHGRTRLPVR
ncbi:MAG: HNH endonuclease [Deltaproteobacteria bacterium]|nr:HNH endonuclease [Deltaproteobacteria bacterium]MBW2532215.1 HNH endonuclease [Deltaproteobacteria bacterium]